MNCSVFWGTKTEMQHSIYCLRSERCIGLVGYVNNEAPFPHINENIGHFIGHQIINVPVQVV